MERAGICIVFLLLVLFLLELIPQGQIAARSQTPQFRIPSVSVLEDPASSLTLEQILSGNVPHPFEQYKDSSLAFGQSRSTWWIRLDPSSIPEDLSDLYLSVNNPTAETVVLYLPVGQGGQIAYESMESGWAHLDQSGFEGVTYPVFRLREGMPADQPIYLKLYTPYTQNYAIEFQTREQLYAGKLQNILAIGIFFGLLLAMGINNLINFFTMRDKARLYYVFYVSCMLLYQNALLGIYRVFLGPSAEVLISHVVTIGLFMLLASILFFRSFLDTPVRFPWEDKIAKIFMVLCAMDIMPFLFGYRHEGSVISTAIASGLALLILLTAIGAVKKGIREARYFLAGWCFMVIGLATFTARVWGLLPNNSITMHVVLLSSVMEALLLSAALADRVKVLKQENERTMDLLRQAEEISITNETAFLQAQIKPHFLYNTFNIIAALCRIDGEKARELILDLSSYLKHSFDFSNLDRFHTFEEELEFVKTYVRIEQARFKDKVQVHYELDDVRELLLPPLVLQPLVENAIRHGIRKKQEGGTVILRVLEREDQYRIEVEDYGVGMLENDRKAMLSGSRKEGQGVGLLNIQRRIQMLYGAGLSISSEEGVGTKVSFSIPRKSGELG